MCRSMLIGVCLLGTVFIACKGDPGEQGIQGAQGPQGPAGPQGPPGPTNVPGSVLIETLDRAGAFTDLARGVPVVASAGTLQGSGPTNEFAATSYWETSVIGSHITVDLGSEQSGIFAILFESHPRGVGTNIPAFSGTSAYTLQYSSDNFATPGTAVPSVAPAQNDIFIHRFTTPVSFRQLRLTNNGPNTIPNPVRVSMIRILAHAPGEATRIDSRRLYGGPLPCRPGFLSVGDGRICMEAAGVRPAATMTVAIGACKALAPGCRVCTHNDMQQACGAGLNPYTPASTGWYGDHSFVTSGDGDDEYLTWNRNFCDDNNDGPSSLSNTATLAYRCCY
jgi:hypothetical protein